MANEIDLDFGTLNLNSTNNVAVSSISLKENKSVRIHNIPKSDGSIAETAKRKSLTITVKGDIGGTDYDDLRTNLDTLKAGLFNGKQKFTTDDDRYITAQLMNFTYNYAWIRTLATWTATFEAHYPFWLAETETTDDRVPTSGAGYTINNAGNAPARVKVEITAGPYDVADTCKLENTTREESLQYRGTIVATKTLEIDNRYDTEDFQVLNDGTDDFKNFEGNFLTLDPGDNTIEFTGSVATSVKLYYRNAWY